MQGQCVLQWWDVQGQHLHGGHLCILGLGGICSPFPGWGNCFPQRELALWVEHSWDVGTGYKGGFGGGVNEKRWYQSLERFWDLETEIPHQLPWPHSFGSTEG